MKEEITKKSVIEILVDRSGKNDDVEIYSNSTEFLIMFKNGYSLIVKEKSKKYAQVFIYKGIVESTDDILGKKGGRKVKRDVVEALVTKLENL